MNISLLGHVDAEGGPLLLCDMELAKGWHGIEQGGADYDRACAFFDAQSDAEGGEVAVGPGTALLWEMAGPGTAFVYRLDDDQLLLVRAWLHEPQAGEEAILELATSPASAVSAIGTTLIESGALLIAWATEDGSELLARRRSETIEDDRGAKDQSASLLARMPVGTYRASHEVTNSGAGTARRLRIAKPHDALAQHTH